MSGTRWDWNGARWWKFDLHSHTPASADYGKGAGQKSLRQRTPREWLLDYMRAGIDCVAITDHNSGAWIDKAREALEELRSQPPEGFRPIEIFAGVEISVHGGIHVLAILGPDKTTSDVDSLLGAVGYMAVKGGCDDVTSRSFEEVASEIAKAGGIAIPAHVDREKGLFKLDGSTLNQALRCKTVLAMEVVDPSASKPGLFTDRKSSWTEVLGSDSHHPTCNDGDRAPGSHFTWIKMSSPTLEGLRLALLDGPLSILRSDEAKGDPNEHAALVIESIEVSEARYMGRAKPFSLTLNPWLNAIVGGRGTGKSTLVEFLRLALRRQHELPDDLQPELEKYTTVSAARSDGGLLTEESAIRVVYRKDGSRFRVQWSESGGLDPIEEEVHGGWQRAEGEVSHRFPARIYSQKQIFHLARSPMALLRIADDAPEVDHGSWVARWREEESRFLSLRAKAREIEAGLVEEPRLKGELEDVIRKLAVFEKAGHAAVLKGFQLRSRQQLAVEAWEQSWANTGARLRELASDLVPDPLDSGSFDADATEDQELRVRAQEVRAELEKIRVMVDGLGDQADTVMSGWRAACDASAWRARVAEAIDEYDGLRKRLEEEGAGDPAAYGELVQRRQALERRLSELSARRARARDLRREAEESLQRLLAVRRALTQSRREFLGNVLKDNPYVRIAVAPYGARGVVETEFRRLIQRERGFEKDIGAPDGEGLLGQLYAGESDAESIERALGNMKKRLHAIVEGEHDGLGDKRFASHLGKLPPESLDRIDVWFPEDSLEVQYSTTSDGKSFRSIQEGSPGQKTAALLAFLLSYGMEPLILDQPEDDLDNHLIYDLIVRQLREVKRKRQIVVVTHNANIVVNGDSELLVALVARGGETHIECVGSLQETDVRSTVCNVMEGGIVAFEQRYRRIALEGRHV